jgi:N-acetyl-anhydromuramyl-L-alanine amidase AmpD
MVGTTAQANDRFQNPSSQVSAHYGVSLDGSIVQWVKEEDTAWQAGEWTVNLTSIGIEHEDGGDFNGIRPDALYTASAKLVRTISLNYGIPIDRQHIVGHREVHPTACPDALDIDRIVREAQGDDMATAQETYDLIALLLQQNIVAPQADTNTAIKAYIDAVAADDKLGIATALTKVGQALERGALLLDAAATK